MTYRISTVADVTGIPRNTLLAWERRYGLVRPTRHDNGYRSYTDRDIAVILRLKDAIAAGLRVSEAIELLRGELHSAPATPRVMESSGSDLAPTPLEILDAILGYRRGEAEDLLARALSLPLETRVRDLYFPILVELEAKSSDRAITVAQEHYASAMLRSHLAGLLLIAGNDSPSTPRAITTTFPGGHQELFALVITLELGASGYRVSYLGPGLEAEQLVRFAREQQVRVACVACTRLPPEEDFTRYLDTLAAWTETRWFVGGRVPQRTPPEGITLFHEWKNCTPDDLKES